MDSVSTSFDDLPQEQQRLFVDFLRKNFVPIQQINSKHTAYGLKQTFTRLHFYVTQE